MGKYRKKPVVIEARVWEGHNSFFDPTVRWAVNNNVDVHFACVDEEKCADGASMDEPHYLVINTLEGPMKASKGDYIIQGVQGEFYPCKPDIFAATYEEVTE